MNNYFGNNDDEDKVFYKMANLDDRIKNADQLITVDLQRFSTGLAEIYSNLAKPTLDIVLYNVQLARNIGAEGMILLTLVVQGSAFLRTWNMLDSPKASDRSKDPFLSQ
jgi:ATP-binding cassette subfamily D (ALD) long-chain fatty acid import protein